MIVSNIQKQFDEQNSKPYEILIIPLQTKWLFFLWIRSYACYLHGLLSVTAKKLIYGFMQRTATEDKKLKL